MVKISESGNPSTFIQVDPLGVLEEVIIELHIVRVYRQGKATISVMRVQTEGGTPQYFAILARTNLLVPDGNHKGYMIRRELKGLREGRKEGNAPEVTQKIIDISKLLEYVDEELPEQFQKPIQTPMGQNGVRIYQDSVTANITSTGRPIGKGGNITLHTGNSVQDVRGCEAVGLYCTNAPQTDNIIGVWKSNDAMYKLLIHILEIYENNLKKENITSIRIYIESDYSLQKHLASMMTKGGFYPEPIYTKLFPAKKKQKPIQLKSEEVVKLNKRDNDAK